MSYNKFDPFAPEISDIDFFSIQPARDWAGREAPEPDWRIDGLVQRGTVMLLSGDGGIGKSLIAQQLCTAAALGLPWLGHHVPKGRAGAIWCEDDAPESWRRQEIINMHYGLERDNHPSGLYYTNRPGRDNVIIEFKQQNNEFAPTVLFDQIRFAVKQEELDLVVIDTLADVFDGNENNRMQVRRFLTLLTGLALEIKGVVVLCSHPSNAGMATGTGISGTGGWKNSVRSHLYIHRDPLEDGADEAEWRKRVKIAVKKNNRGEWGVVFGARWDNGVFVRDDSHITSQSMDTVDRLELANVIVDFVEGCVTEGAKVYSDPMSRLSVYNRMKSNPNYASTPKGAILAAVRSLIESGKLVTIEHDGKVLLRPPYICYPFE